MFLSDNNCSKPRMFLAGWWQGWTLLGLLEMRKGPRRGTFSGTSKMFHISPLKWKSWQSGPDRRNFCQSWILSSKYGIFLNSLKWNIMWHFLDFLLNFSLIFHSIFTSNSFHSGLWHFHLYVEHYLKHPLAFLAQMAASDCSFSRLKTSSCWFSGCSVIGSKNFQAVSNFLANFWTRKCSDLFSL